MRLTRFSLVAFIFFVACGFSASAQDTGKANEILLAATSPYEDMVDFALTGDDADIIRALSAADNQAPSVRSVLPAVAAGRFDELRAGIHTAASEKKHQALAESAVGVFRLLLEGLKPDSLKVPREVSLLDYAGFKLQVLQAAPRPDWDAMRTTAGEASVWWKTLKPNVSDTALRDAISTTIAGLLEAANGENLAMLRLAIHIDLDLVDLLENHFEQKQ